MEHPDYGLARVLFRRVRGWKAGWRWEPTGVEFDLFTPDSEKAELMRMLREEVEADRIDRSSSVRGLDGLRGLSLPSR